MCEIPRPPEPPHDNRGFCGDVKASSINSLCKISLSLSLALTTAQVRSVPPYASWGRARTLREGCYGKRESYISFSQEKQLQAASHRAFLDRRKKCSVFSAQLFGVSLSLPHSCSLALSLLPCFSSCLSVSVVLLLVSLVAKTLVLRLDHLWRIGLTLLGALSQNEEALRTHCLCIPSPPTLTAVLFLTPPSRSLVYISVLLTHSLKHFPF